MDAMPKPTMKSPGLRAVLRTWRALKNARMAFFQQAARPLQTLAWFEPEKHHGQGTFF
jgi:hypothetical protein